MRIRHVASSGRVHSDPRAAPPIVAIDEPAAVCRRRYVPLVLCPPNLRSVRRIHSLQLPGRCNHQLRFAANLDQDRRSMIEARFGPLPLPFDFAGRSIKGNQTRQVALGAISEHQHHVASQHRARLQPPHPRQTARFAFQTMWPSKSSATSSEEPNKTYTYLPSVHGVAAA